MASISTIRICDGDEDFLTINAADFDEARHERWPRAKRQLSEEEQRAAWIAEQLKHPAADVIAKVKQAPMDQIAVLKAMRDAEAKGKNRSTVLDAIDAHVAALTKPVE